MTKAASEKRDMLEIMRIIANIAAICSLLVPVLAAQQFSGKWRLNPAQSDIRDTTAKPADTIQIRQDETGLSLYTGDALLTYPLDGKSLKTTVGDSTWNVVTKWEGDSLLTNIIVSGPGNYSIAERWTRSKDGNRLTIGRNVIRTEGETESSLVYINSVAPALQERAPRALEPGALQTGEFVLPSGTRILTRLTNTIDTKHAATGDRVYLQTAAPVFVSGRLIIPVGSYVTGTVTEAQRAGHVKGKAALNLRFESVTLPNGVTRDFRGRAGSADSHGTLDRTEGKITGEGRTGSSAKTVATTAAAGTGIGTLAGAAAGHVGAGMGIGAAAGAAAGLAGVFSKRGPDVIVQAGSTIEMVLDRELRFYADELPPPAR